MKRRSVSTLDQVRKPERSLADRLAGMVGLPGGVPEDVEFEIVRRTTVGFLKRLQSRVHDLTRRRQGVLLVVRVAARPEFRPDLKTRDFAPGTDCAIVIAAFEHRKRGPTIHRW